MEAISIPFIPSPPQAIIPSYFDTPTLQPSATTPISISATPQNSPSPLTAPASQAVQPTGNTNTPATQPTNLLGSLINGISGLGSFLNPATMIKGITDAIAKPLTGTPATSASGPATSSSGPANSGNSGQTTFGAVTIGGGSSISSGTLLIIAGVGLITVLLITKKKK